MRSSYSTDEGTDVDSDSIPALGGSRLAAAGSRAAATDSVRAAEGSGDRLSGGHSRAAFQTPRARPALFGFSASAAQLQPRSAAKPLLTRLQSLTAERLLGRRAAEFSVLASQPPIAGWRSG